MAVFSRHNAFQGSTIALAAVIVGSMSIPGYSALANAPDGSRLSAPASAAKAATARHIGLLHAKSINEGLADIRHHYP